MSPAPLVFGAAGISTGGKFVDPADVNAVFDALEANGINTLDTAQMYGDSETVLGKANVAARPFIVDSKVPGGWIPGTLEPSKLRADARASIKKLGVKKLDVFYIHGPDEKASIEDALAALDELHKEGIYTRLGLSNFKADDVQKIYDLTVKNNWVRPTVYQGNYSAFARHLETHLFPTLRKLGFAFYAYSPVAGGFLARSDLTQFKGDNGGRFAENGGIKMYQELYSLRPALLNGLVKWGEISKAAGCESPAELAYRWIASNSFLDPEKGDKVIMGASKIEQISKTAGWIKKGPLDPGTVKAIDEIWPTIEKEAPLDNWHK